MSLLNKADVQAYREAVIQLTKAGDAVRAKLREYVSAATAGREAVPYDQLNEEQRDVAVLLFNMRDIESLGGRVLADFCPLLDDEGFDDMESYYISVAPPAMLEGVRAAIRVMRAKTVEAREEARVDLIGLRKRQAAESAQLDAMMQSPTTKA